MVQQEAIEDVQQVEESQRRSFLFACVDAHGHLNALIGMANFLRSRGHKTAFLFASKFPVPNNHTVYDTESLKPIDVNAPVVPAEEKFAAFIPQLRKTFLLSSKEVNEFMYSTSFPMLFKANIIDDAPYVEKILDMVKPDVVIVDHLMVQPVLASHPKFVRVQSATPLAVWHSYYPELPPEYYGYPTKSPRELVDEYVKLDHEMKEGVHKLVKDFCKQYNVDVKDHTYIVESPNLNIYIYPQVLDYVDVCPKGLPSNWLQVDDLVRRDFNGITTKKEFKIPELLADKPGKLIFVSMGTLASMDVTLMKRLVSILSHSPNKFIFAKGISHDQYELNEDNMWGERFVDQLTVLQNVDLVITHGGNNTITECLYYGVPGMIVCPLFGDQMDNAQRIEEKGLGVKLNPYKATQEDFLNAIDKLLTDDSIKSRMKVISENLKKQDNIGKACARLEELALK